MGQLEGRWGGIGSFVRMSQHKFINPWTNTILQKAPGFWGLHGEQERCVSSNINNYPYNNITSKCLWRFCCPALLCWTSVYAFELRVNPNWFQLKKRFMKKQKTSIAACTVILVLYVNILNLFLCLYFLLILILFTVLLCVVFFYIFS